MNDSGVAPVAVRCIQTIAFVGLWAAAGLTLRLDGNAYLLLGVPLTVAFQRWVRRKPLREMWVRDGPPFRLSRRLALIAIALAVVPATDLVAALSAREWEIAGWAACAIAGAFAAAWSLGQFSRTTLRELLLCLAIGGSISGGLFAASALVSAALLHRPLHPDLRYGVVSLLRYLPGLYLLEEVSFRGVLDAHVHPQREPRGFASAFFVSALWGLWHWPIAPASGAPGWQVALQLAIFHSLVGAPLSIFWRRSGNLAVPAFTHAFADALRNALGLVH